MQQPSNLPQQIRVPKLGGINERVSVSGLEPGEFSYQEGLYANQVGQLSRVPGKVLKLSIPNGTPILQLTQTFNRNGDVLIQTTTGRYAATLDEIQGRLAPFNLTPGTNPGTPTAEEAMSIGIMFQEEANGVNGGSIGGWISGTDNASLTNTLYPRRLTICPSNQSSAISSFAASTGGSGGASVAGTFTLATGTYRIKAWLTFSSGSGASASFPSGFLVGLWNTASSGSFQLDDGSGPAGGGAPIIAQVAYSNTTASGNIVAYLEGRFVVSGSPATFQIMQAVVGAATAGARVKTMCGNAAGFSATLVNGAAPKERYATVEILQEP